MKEKKKPSQRREEEKGDSREGSTVDWKKGGYDWGEELFFLRAI